MNRNSAIHARHRALSGPEVSSIRKSSNRRIHARGGVLLEVLLALALFAGAAAFTLGCVQSVFSAFDRTRRLQEAVDLARSKMAELEAGMITLADLRGEAIEAVGSSALSGNLGGSSSPFSGGGKPRWVVDVKTRRSEFTSLSLVELTVREDFAAGQVGEDKALSYTLHQLMPLRATEAEEYPSDELSEVGNE